VSFLVNGVSPDSFEELQCVWHNEGRESAVGTRHKLRLSFLEEEAQVFCNLHPEISTNYSPFPSADRAREGNLAGAELNLLGVFAMLP
jgi:hypothetical protein